MDARVDRIVVSDLKDDTFFAVIWLEKNGEFISIDSRPSDALAIALRTDSPIFVDDSVLKNSRMSSSSEKGKDEELKKLLENLNEEDFGRYKM
jgi:bifunctional DNase/RNase